MFEGNQIKKIDERIAIKRIKHLDLLEEKNTFTVLKVRKVRYADV